MSICDRGFRSCATVLFAALLPFVVSAGVTVSVNEVVPTDTASGIVDIEYTISYDGGTTLTPDECLEVYAVN